MSFSAAKRVRGGVPLALLMVVLAGVAPIAAQEEVKKPDDAKPAAGATVAAEKGRFEVTLEAKGDFEPVDPVVVQLKPDQWASPLEIVRVLPHGARVNAGDAIVEFDTEKIDRAIADLEIDLAIGEKALEIARRDLPVSEALEPLELASTERDARVAAEDLARFLAIGRSQAEEAARFRLRSSEQQLKYSREELRQLEKMYRDKDLTEETEEMILQRTRFDVESAEMNLKRAGIDAETALQFEIPRRESTLREAAEKATLAAEKARGTSGLALEQKRLALAKSERDRAEALRKMRDLRQDRAGMPLKAPRAGLVYMGRLHDGAWSTAAVAAKAAVGQSVPAPDMVFTVVDPERVVFLARIDEKDLHLLAPGLAGRVEPTGRPDDEVAVTLDSVATVPRDGKIDARFAVAVPPGAPRPLPAMTGTAKLRVHARPDAITLPATAVFRDDDGRRVVWIPGADGAAPAKRVVKTGRTSGGRTEILDGVAAGETVLASRP